MGTQITQMVKLFKKLIALTILVVMIFSFTIPLTAFAAPIGNEEISSEAAIVIDFDSGLVIYEYNADALRVPASMTKIIFAYTVFDAIRDNVVSFDTIVTTTEEISRFSYMRDFSNIPMPLGSSYTISELLDAIIVRSACAATVALAEAVFGNEAAAVARMNEKLGELGVEAVFYDSWGRSPNNKISARGMATVARSIIKEYPEVLSISSKRSIMFDGISYNSTNFLVRNYEGVDGLKTGFTNPAGWCFTGTAVRKDRRIISVTMGSSEGLRFVDSRILLDYGFSNVGPVIANHFRDLIRPENAHAAADNALVPIISYNVEDAQYFKLHDLAIILNES